MSEPGTRIDTKKKILFVSHSASRCGIHEFGVNITQAIQKSTRYSFEYRECTSPKEYLTAVETLQPSAVIFNYHLLTMPWLNKGMMSDKDLIYIGIMHEVTQQRADCVNNRFFQYHIAPDPTLLLKNPIVFKTGRLIPNYPHPQSVAPTTPVIGSFGFGLKGKGFERILSIVQEEFDEAVVRFHIPYSQFCDDDGEQAKAIANHCRSLIKKKGIKLTLSHEFLPKEKLLNFLAQNTINAFLYDEYKGRGVSSVIDYALAVKRPIAITKSTMFRHLFSCEPSICIENTTLQEIIHNGIQPLQPYLEEWTETNLIWDYERIMDKIFRQHQEIQSQLRFDVKKEAFTLFHKIMGRHSFNQWVSGDNEKIFSQEKNFPQLAVAEYAPVPLPETTPFNRILDNTARGQFKKTIEKLFELSPETMTRKIPEANVQQAFVFDTAYRFASKLSSPKILCVGSFEDTAAAGLKKLGYRLDEIDPLLNYDLNEFIYKPSTKPASYDIIISTSVLEHVKEDALFLTQIAQLLAPGGIAILTCDYNDQYQTGDRLPSVDFRFYTQQDFKKRLLPRLKDCALIDTPAWDCPDPDFTYGKCQYTFATLVFRRNKT